MPRGEKRQPRYLKAEELDRLKAYFEQEQLLRWQHDLRSTFASYFMMNGGNILELKEIFGHEDLKTVLIYATLSREALHKHKNVVGF